MPEGASVPIEMATGPSKGNGSRSQDGRCAKRPECQDGSAAKVGLGVW